MAVKGEDFMEPGDTIPPEGFEDLSLKMSEPLTNPLEALVPIMELAYGLKAGTHIAEIGLIGSRSSMRGLVVQDVIVHDEPLRIEAIRVNTDGAQDSYLIPWHAVVFIKR